GTRETVRDLAFAPLHPRRRFHFGAQAGARRGCPPLIHAAETCIPRMTLQVFMQLRPASVHVLALLELTSVLPACSANQAEQQQAPLPGVTPEVTSGQPDATGSVGPDPVNGPAPTYDEELIDPLENSGTATSAPGTAQTCKL